MPKIYNEGMDPIDALTNLVIRAHRIGRVVAREAGSTTPAAQWRALSTLEEEGPLRIGELAAACRVTQPGMTRLVAQMVEHGLVARRHDPVDERAVRLEVTDAGRAAHAAWIATIRETLAPWFADLSEEERAAIETAAAVLAARTPDLPIGANR